MAKRKVAMLIDGKKFHVVFCQKWEESERGWGTRPDGYSLHLTAEDLKRYIKEYWMEMPDAVPDEYSLPDGNSYLTLVKEEVYAELIGRKRYQDKKRLGLRELGRAPKPVSGN